MRLFPYIPKMASRTSERISGFLLMYKFASRYVQSSRDKCVHDTLRESLYSGRTPIAARLEYEDSR